MQRDPARAHAQRRKQCVEAAQLSLSKRQRTALCSDAIDNESCAATFSVCHHGQPYAFDSADSSPLDNADTDFSNNNDGFCTTRGAIRYQSEQARLEILSHLSCQHAKRPPRLYHVRDLLTIIDRFFEHFMLHVCMRRACLVAFSGVCDGKMPLLSEVKTYADRSWPLLHFGPKDVANLSRYPQPVSHTLKTVARSDIAPETCRFWCPLLANLLIFGIESDTVHLCAGLGHFTCTTLKNFEVDTRLTRIKQLCDWQRCAVCKTPVLVRNEYGILCVNPRACGHFVSSTYNTNSVFSFDRDLNKQLKDRRSVLHSSVLKKPYGF